MSKDLFPNVSENQKNEADDQIKEKQKETDFDIREYPIEVIVSKFTTKLEDDRAELFIPDYQREMIWKEPQQARFIESILLNLPIPYLYVADVTSGENEGRLEIVDGSQRIRTLVRFIGNELQLQRLELLNKLNGFYFDDLPLSRQLRFQRKTMRMIELIEVDEEARRQLFDRLNSGGTKLKDMEKRFGSRDGDFMPLIRELAASERFQRLCPVSAVRVKHREYEEMVLRFFAYLDRYQNFNKRVDDFLDAYLDEMNAHGFDQAKQVQIFDNMLSFVEQFFPYGFRKASNNSSVPRIRFEAISVGVALAQDLGCTSPADMTWLDSEAFKVLTRSDASNSRPKVINRIHFVRDSLLGVQPALESDDGLRDDNGTDE
ncbi:DUF262 domain-containing protein [Dyella terrae]|uniref:DUF262 domain-containing protein n=1 Tax=Dyella terrae TaxID=522259 RepID=UPI001EFD647F|nr:DUF262 domain-containing protein [Dyella terrae]ULU24389.1 DUF262 protein [Dyella terrae]